MPERLSALRVWGLGFRVQDFRPTKAIRLEYEMVEATRAVEGLTRRVTITNLLAIAMVTGHYC